MRGTVRVCMPELCDRGALSRMPHGFFVARRGNPPAMKLHIQNLQRTAEPVPVPTEPGRHSLRKVIKFRRVRRIHVVGRNRQAKGLCT